MSESGTPLESQKSQDLKVEQKESLPKAFAGSELVRLAETQKRENGFSGILFSDIDNTFVKKGKASASEELSKLARENKFPIVAVTGNSFSVVLERIESGELPYFEAIAGAVGTEIYVLHVDENGVKRYEKDEDFERKMLSKGFDRTVLNRSASEMIDSFKATHQDWSLVFQKPEIEEAYMKAEDKNKVEGAQPFKISFHAFASSKEEVKAMYSEVSSRFPNEKVLICEEINYNDKMAAGDLRKKYCIDILPATKRDAVDYISQAVKSDLKVIAGDSGNDTEMLTGTGDVSISVGGSKPELREAIQNATQESSGRISFRKVIMPDGTSKYYYVEEGARLGPESILYAVEVLRRAQRIAKIRSSRIQSTSVSA